MYASRFPKSQIEVDICCANPDFFSSSQNVQDQTTLYIHMPILIVNYCQAETIVGHDVYCL